MVTEKFVYFLSLIIKRRLVVQTPGHQLTPISFFNKFSTKDLKLDMLTSENAKLDLLKGF